MLSCYKDKITQLWKYHSTEQALETRSIEQVVMKQSKIYAYIVFIIFYHFLRI